MLLYQYRGSLDGKGFGYLRDLLTVGKMKFTPPKEFNDPFDCCPEQLCDESTEGLPHAVVDQLNRSVQSAHSSLVGIACFTPHPDKIVMWSHYGDHHRSVCVGIDADILFEKIPVNSDGNKLVARLGKVDYKKSRPKAHDNDVWLRKSEEWSYEDEYRLISEMQSGEPAWGPGLWNIPVSAIKQIVIGARMPSLLKEKVATLAKESLPDIEIKQCVVQKSQYKLSVEDYESQPQPYQTRGYVHSPNGDWLPIRDDR